METLFSEKSYAVSPVKTIPVNLDQGSTPIYIGNAGWSSPVARWAHNPKVAGSNPAPATNPFNNLAENQNYRLAPNIPQ